VNKEKQLSISGSYTANLLGNIKSHLAGLQGYDVMALELIQNADDAKSKSIVFDITDQGLLVSNRSKFSYCGNLDEPCKLRESENYSCDFHRIVDVGSAGKLSDSEYIGRFGIGFVSVYQITDCPSIVSSSVKLTLHPELRSWRIESSDLMEGTIFILPWAEDPKSKTRMALNLSSISSEHINQLAMDVQKILRNSLLFLRHIQRAELRRNDELLFSSEIERGEGPEVLVRFGPNSEIEKWSVLRADAKEMALHLCTQDPQLKRLDRGTKVDIGLRTEPALLNRGLLYAFLPTEQSTGLPLHINADFFPESNRKSIIFAGNQHQQSWNEMLIDFSATELAKDPELLLELLGDEGLWGIIDSALTLSKSTNNPDCYKQFWKRFYATATDSLVTRASDGSLLRPKDVLYSDKQLSVDQKVALREIRGQVVDESLRRFRNALMALGSPMLTIDALIDMLTHALTKHSLESSQIDEERVCTFYLPICVLVDSLLPQPISRTHPIRKKLDNIPFIFTEDLYAVAIGQTYVVPSNLNTGLVASLLPSLAIASDRISKCSNLGQLIEPLTLSVVVCHLKSECADMPAKHVVPEEEQELKQFYSLFSDLDTIGTTEFDVYQDLRSLPIWPSKRGLMSASHALLPGDFTDPTGEADLLDLNHFTVSAKEFVSNKLRVRTQTIEAFTMEVLPRFFNESGPLDYKNFLVLIKELAAFPTLLNNEDIRKALASLSLVPTLDGNWSPPKQTYRRTEHLVIVLGDAKHLWIDESRLPDGLSVQQFIDNLGIRRSPAAEHLVERMIMIADCSLPSENARKDSSEAFYALCDHYNEWKEEPFFQEALNKLKKAECFPAMRDTQKWHIPKTLCAPFRAEGFDSYGKILDFRNPARLNSELTRQLGVADMPETSVVIDHLRNCVSQNTPAHITTYQILNERSSDEGHLISSLGGEGFIYVDKLTTFVRTDQLFWLPQRLGSFAYSIPEKYFTFKQLFKSIGVKDSPDAHDYVTFILEIVGRHCERSTKVEGEDFLIYENCMTGLQLLYERNEVSDAEMERLQLAPSVLNINGQPMHPEDMLLHDSEWYAGFFDGVLDKTLCRPAQELWTLVEKTGVDRFSKCAEVKIHEVTGTQAVETELAQKLNDRADLLTRLLYDKPTSLQKHIRNAISKLTAVSYEEINVRALVRVTGDGDNAPPRSSGSKRTKAFYDRGNSQLIVERPLNDRCWPHILNAIFHQLMPDESGSEISKLTTMAGPRMGMSLESAHQDLTDSGIRELGIESESLDTLDITSATLDTMGTTDETNFQTENKQDTAPINVPENEEHEQVTPPKSTLHFEMNNPPEKENLREPVQIDTDVATGSQDMYPLSSDETKEYGKSNNKGSSTSAHSFRGQLKKSKKQWNQRLLSYAQMNILELNNAPGRDIKYEHNQAVEVLARDAVCKYEHGRGRIAEQMPITHPGYDIISRHPVTGEKRFIEVKGVSGEWNQTGVGLSDYQFNLSKDNEFESRYWLYVVESVSDHNHTRVLPIFDPAAKVKSFMFDSNWRYAVTDERADPTLAFVTGATIKHNYHGKGKILSMKKDGSSKVLSIEFEKDGRRMITLNVAIMSVVTEDDE
jgi:hypothetical protein